jgi:hypothetical protein
MSVCPNDETLQDLLDGALPPDREAEAAAHLNDCAACAAAWDELLGLRAAAADLPEGVSPGRDLWPGIAARIAADGAPDAEDAIVRPRFAGHRRRLAAAAVAAFALLAVPRLFESGAGDPYDDLARGYTAVSEDCRAGLREAAPALPAETRAAVDEGLDLIDQAMRETRHALETVASAPSQASRLVAGYHKKMDLLQNLARLASR